MNTIKSNWKNMNFIEIYQISNYEAYMMCHSNLMKRRWITRHSSVYIFILIVLTNQVGNFKGINIKLLTFKWSKVWSKWKVCTLSTNFRWSRATMTSKLLQQGLKSEQLSQPRQCNHHAKTNLVFVCSQTKVVCTMMKRWGHACPTSFDRNRNGEFVRQYLQIPLLLASDGKLI